MAPAIGSEWIARDGRRMRVDDVIVPVDPRDMPWCKMTVLNPGKRMRRHTTMGIASFGSETHFGFLRPSGTTEARAANATHDDVKKLMGHSARSETSSKVYDRARLEAQRRIAQARKAHRERE